MSGRSPGVAGLLTLPSRLSPAPICLHPHRLHPLKPQHPRSLYTSVMSDMTFTSCVLDLAHGLLMIAAGPLWQQLQRTDLRPAER